MKKLAVGSRVRVLWVNRPAASWKVGREGVVIEVHDVPDFETLYGLDMSPLCRWEENGTRFTRGFGADQLEPIVPEGHQPSTQSHEQLMADLRKGVIHA